MDVCVDVDVYADMSMDMCVDVDMYVNVNMDVYVCLWMCTLWM